VSIGELDMAESKIGYQHFCPAARALEVVGEKWSLLIVRDLLAGARRFSDLRRSLVAITPKWLSARLRALEAQGIVEREAAGEHAGWYRLTPRGQALSPVIDALLVWGMDHALGAPRPGEVIHPGRAMDAAVHYLDRRGVRPARAATWVLRFGDDRSYTLRFDGARWSRQRGEAPADVAVAMSPEEWVAFLAADPDERLRRLRARRAEGRPERLRELAAAFGARPTSTFGQRAPAAFRPHARGADTRAGATGRRRRRAARWPERTGPARTAPARMAASRIAAAPTATARRARR
jgi:DNA-binding HxlR family transcriptional regulator